MVVVLRDNSHLYLNVSAVGVASPRFVRDGHAKCAVRTEGAKGTKR
jgi:hypothetical protein